MRIGIDASRAARERPTGVERYSYHLIAGLLELAASRSDLQIELYSDRALPGTLAGPDGITTQRVLPFTRAWTHLRLSAELHETRPDVLFVPGHVIPALHPPRTVVTIHDLGYLAYPEAHPTLDRWYLDLSTRWNVHEATLVITPSRATEADLVNRLRADPARIRVIPSGVDPLFLQPVSPACIDEVRARYGIQGDYILTVCTVHPRKNLLRLLQAFAQLRGLFGVEHRLVVVGKTGWKTEQFEAISGMLGDAVVWTGYVPQEDLPALYAGAEVFAFPSLFEGFGFPLLEAMATGTPVLTSNTTSMPEVGGNAAFYVEPEDVDSIAGGLLALLRSSEARQQLRTLGLDRVRRFTWHASATKTLAVLEEAARMPLASRNG